MPRKEFPGDPRRDDAVVPYTPATSNEGSMYYMIAFISSMAALFSKIKWIGWIALFASLFSMFTDRLSAAGSSSGSSRISTITLALTSLMMTYLPEILAVYKLAKGTSAASDPAAAAAGKA